MRRIRRPVEPRSSLASGSLFVVFCEPGGGLGLGPQPGDRGPDLRERGGVVERAVGPLARLDVVGCPGLMWNEHGDGHHAVVASRHNEVYQLKRVELARRERWPVPVVSLGTVAIQYYDSRSSYIGLSVPVPLFDHGQGLIAGASADRELAALETAAVLRENEAQLHLVFRRLEHRRSALQTYEADVLKTIPALQRLVKDAVRDGNPYSAIDVTLTIYNVRLGHIDLIEGLVRAELDVLAAAGRIEVRLPADGTRLLNVTTLRELVVAGEPCRSGLRGYRGARVGPSVRRSAYDRRVAARSRCEPELSAVVFAASIEADAARPEWLITEAGVGDRLMTTPRSRVARARASITASIAA